MCDCMYTRMHTDSALLNHRSYQQCILSIPECVTLTHPDKTAYMCGMCSATIFMFLCKLTQCVMPVYNFNFCYHKMQSYPVIAYIIQK